MIFMKPLKNQPVLQPHCKVQKIALVSETCKEESPNFQGRVACQSEAWADDELENSVYLSMNLS